MITMSKLGKLGALGNQLFQYATLFGVSKKTGFEMKIPAPPGLVDGNLRVLGHVDDKYPIEKYDYSLGCFKIKSKYLTEKELESINTSGKKKNKPLYSIFSKKIKYRYLEPEFHYNPSIFKIRDKTNISGYFQSEKYFEHCSKEIRKQFEVQEKIFDKASKLMSAYRNGSNQIVSIHVRRKGHEKLKHQKVHKYNFNKYYKNAMVFFENNFPNVIFVIFSDDIQWCESNFRGPNIFFSKKNSAIVDFAMMKSCEHNIIVPSSYSWWASWLNKNDKKIVTMPDGNLFGIDGPKKTNDYLFKGIKRISIT